MSEHFLFRSETADLISLGVVSIWADNLFKLMVHLTEKPIKKLVIVVIRRMRQTKNGVTTDSESVTMEEFEPVE